MQLESIGKPCGVWKNDSDISSTSSYDFTWNLAKALALPHLQRRSLNGLASSVQLKINMFLGKALLVDEPVLKAERRFTETGQREDGNYTWPIATQRQKRTMPQNQLSSANHMVSVFSGNIQCESVFAMVAYMKFSFIFHIHCT